MEQRECDFPSLSGNTISFRIHTSALQKPIPTSTVLWFNQTRAKAWKYCTNNLCIQIFLLRYWIWKGNTGEPVFYKRVDNPMQVKVLRSGWCSRDFKLCFFKIQLIAGCFFTNSSVSIERYFSVTGITDLSLKALSWNISVWVKT